MAIAGAFVVPHPPIIFPEIGRGEELKISSTINAYREAAKRIALMQPETIVIISPHTTMYKDYFHISPGFSAAGDFSRFGAASVKIKTEYDAILSYEIEKQALEDGVPAGMDGEREKELDHGTMIPLRFIKEVYKSPFKIVRIGLSDLPFSEHYKAGECIRKAADKLKKRIVVIASGDLSHRLFAGGPYGYRKEGPEYDEAITKLLSEGCLEKTLEFSEDLCEKAGECGHRSIAMLAGCMSGVEMKAELLSYEGPFGVGYAVAAFKDVYVSLAEDSLKYYLENGEIMPLPEGLPSEMLYRQAGTFVSLKKYGDLRGCIGTISGVRSCIAEEIIENAVSAGIWDPRFKKVALSELEDIVITVDVLLGAEPVASQKELDIKRYGVIVSCGNKRGLLLPNLEGVNSIEEQINIALAKAGIDGENYKLERFEVVRHY